MEGLWKVMEDLRLLTDTGALEDGRRLQATGRAQDLLLGGCGVDGAAGGRAELKTSRLDVRVKVDLEGFLRRITDCQHHQACLLVSIGRTWLYSTVSFERCWFWA